MQKKKKTTVQYHFTLISITMINTGKQKISVGESVEKTETLIHHWNVIILFY